jgi:hypothetical protein
VDVEDVVVGFIIDPRRAEQLLIRSRDLGGHGADRHSVSSNLRGRLNEPQFFLLDPNDELKLPSGFRNLEETGIAASEVLKNARGDQIEAIRVGRNKGPQFLTNANGKAEIEIETKITGRFAFGGTVRELPTQIMAMAIQHSTSTAARFLIVTFYPKLPKDYR